MPCPPANTAVIRSTDPGQIGMTTGRERQQAGMLLCEVAWGPNNREFVPEQFLQPFDPTRKTGRQATESFGRAEDLRRLLTFEKLRGALHDFLYSMDAAQIDFLPYQFRPVLKFIESPTERLLLADEVGLGKTIEATLIWLELQARRDARRLLIVCPNMIATKWRRELREKFSIEAEIGGVQQLQQAVADFRLEGESTRFAWICTYSGLRPPKKDIPHLGDEDAELSPRGALARTFLRWDENHDVPFFDLVIFDEAHYMRNPEASASRLGTVISNAAQSVLCVSATPVNNKSTDLFTLLRYVDPDFFENESLYNILLQENAPAVHAMSALRRLPSANPAMALEHLRRLRQSRFVGETELLSRAIDTVERLDGRDRGSLLRAQEMTENLNILGSYISRTRRAQVQARQPVRQPMILPVEFNAEERAFYQAITRMVRERVARSGSSFSAFHLVMPQQRMASCIPAMVAAFRAGDFGDPGEILSESFDIDAELIDEFKGSERPADVPKSIEALLRHDFEKHDTKFIALREALHTLGSEKLIIFAFYKATLFYLQRRLEAEGIRCALIHGGITEQAEREREIDRFRDDPKVQVLLSSEVGSEGIDLQFCHIVVNYDLPWNPMRIAQRIGRIDRVGQEAQVLKIVHFKVRDTIEERLYDRLHDKLMLAESSLGDMEAILGEEIQKLTLVLLSQELTPEQEIERIEQTERALERHRLELERLDKEGGNLIALSDYVQDKVDQNRSLGRYLSADELRHYINDFFNLHERGSGCRLSWDTPERDIFQLELDFAAQDALREFVKARKLDARAEHVGKRFTATLVPEISKKRRRVGGHPLLLINHLSPLVRWITHEWENRGGFHPLSALRLRDPVLAAGTYAYRVERWRFTGLRDMNFMSYSTGRLGSPELLQPDDAERFVSALLRRGTTWLEAERQIPNDDVAALADRLQGNLGDRFELHFDDFKARNDNLAAIQQTQIRNHFQRRRALDERRLETLRARGRSPRLIHAVEVKITKDEDKQRDRLAALARKARPDFELREVAAGVVLVETGESHAD